MTFLYFLLKPPDPKKVEANGSKIWLTKKAQVLIFVTLLYLQNHLNAQETAQVILPQTRIETGDSFLIKIMVKETNAKPLHANFAVWNEILPQKNLLHQSEWTLSGKIWVKDAFFIAFDSADLKLPPLTIELANQKIIKTQASEISIFPTKSTASLADMDDIRDIVHEPVHWWDYWPWLFGAVVLSALFWFFSKKKPKPQTVQTIAIPQPIFINPHEIAQQKIANLHQKNLWKTGQQKEYCAELSLIVREFLEIKFQFPAMESTTPEIMEQLKNKDFNPNQRQALKELLEQTDMAKFAKYIPEEIVKNEKGYLDKILKIN
jgi:hypothetical protein